MICIGIDGGGTTTRAVIVRFESATPRVLGSGNAPSSNHYSVGLAMAAQHIAQAADEALKNARLDRQAIGAWGLGLAGACTHTEQQLWREQLASVVEAARIVVDEDVAAAHAGAFACDHEKSAGVKSAGVICIAGTGANSFGIDANGKRARADGWGHLLGDRGSGYRIGEDALRAVCALNDQTIAGINAGINGAVSVSARETSSLLVRVLDHFQVDSVEALLPIVYAPDFTKDRVAALVPVVAQCARDDDQIAREILQNAGHALAATCASVMTLLNLFRVASHGSILQNADVVRQSFEEDLRSRFSNLEIVTPRYNASIGAAFLARDFLARDFLARDFLARDKA